ncbi:hypothetical protein CAC42_1949 [Sphaceloma murrayae]|uniref:Uncharacterized protein n=1 Tax=Sphaceloma murrayae TaxID=2082308 RepID=A0A2K1QM04_9PEZI|nr:hypothetical protein CAC42_1949 [Sphaceloma murrayae]
MSNVPNAWEDDWVQAADVGVRIMKNPSATPASQKILTKSQRKAEHAEANKKLWEAAEQPQRFHFLESKTGDVPLKTEFRPQMKVLSRKPQATAPANGMVGLSIHDDDDSEEEERKRAAESLAERQKKAALEREEKQRKYAEARERIMGTSSAATDGAAKNAAAGGSRQSSRRGRGPGGRGSHPGSPAEQSPARAPQTKQLFDPGYSSRTQAGTTPRAITPAGEQPVRMPRGPDSSGRRGFAARGRGG